MITLHGFAYSNYYNIVKHQLLHKGLPFEEDLQFGSAQDYRKISPLGKVPAITTADGRYLSETGVICDYLEDTYPGQSPLYPSDSFERARVRQVMRVSELYLELAARRLIPFTLGGNAPPAPLANEVVAVLERAVPAMNSLCSFAPYVMGESLTLADIYLRYVLHVVAITKKDLGRDFAAEINGLAAWVELMDSSDIARRIDADREANGPAFFAFLKEKYGV